MALPLEMRKSFGHALDFAQRGDKHDAAKPLKGFGGAGVLEIVEDDAGGTYRAVYTVVRGGGVCPSACIALGRPISKSSAQSVGHASAPVLSLTDLPALGQLVLGDEKSVHVDVLALPLSGLHERAVRHKSQAQFKIFPISNDALFRLAILLKVPVQEISLRDL